MTDKIEGYERFLGIRAKVIERHRMADDDERTDMLAGLLLCQERMIERMAHGQNVDFSAFAKVLELVDRHVPAPNPELTLRVIKYACANNQRRIGGDTSAPFCDYGAQDYFAVCPKCGVEQPPDRRAASLEPPPPPETPPSSPPSPPSSSPPSSSNGSDNTAPPAAPTAKAVTPRTVSPAVTLGLVDPNSIHAQVVALPNGELVCPPLKALQQLQPGPTASDVAPGYFATAAEYSKASLSEPIWPARDRAYESWARNYEAFYGVKPNGTKQ